MTLQKSLRSISACSLIGRNSFFFERWFVLCSEKAALVSIDNAGIIGYDLVKAFFSVCDKTTCFCEQAVCGSQSAACDVTGMADVGANCSSLGWSFRFSV